jgi:hypothetical protein
MFMRGLRKLTKTATDSVEIRHRVEGYLLGDSNTRDNNVSCGISAVIVRLHAFLPAVSGMIARVVASAHHACFHRCTVCAMWEIFKLSFGGGGCGSKKCKRVYGGAYGGAWRSLRSAEVCNLKVCCISGFRHRERFHILLILQSNCMNFVLSCEVQR